MCLVFLRDVFFFLVGGGLWNRSILFPSVSVSSAFVRRSIRGSCLQSENRCCDHYPVGTWKFLFVKLVWNHLFHFFWEAIFEPRTQKRAIVLVGRFCQELRAFGTIPCKKGQQNTHYGAIFPTQSM